MDGDYNGKAIFREVYLPRVAFAADGVSADAPNALTTASVYMEGGASIFEHPATFWTVIGFLICPMATETIFMALAVGMRR